MSATTATLCGFQKHGRSAKNYGKSDVTGTVGTKHSLNTDWLLIIVFQGLDTVQLGWQNTAPLAKSSDLPSSSACEFNCSDKMSPDTQYSSNSAQSQPKQELPAQCVLWWQLLAEYCRRHWAQTASEHKEWHLGNSDASDVVGACCCIRLQYQPNSYQMHMKSTDTTPTW
jgi:hypothetical protein